jgi:hypothetical protein
MDRLAGGFQNMTECLLPNERQVGMRAGMIVLCVAIAVGGCTMTETQQRTASGAGIGAGVGAAGGALIGALTGNAGRRSDRRAFGCSGRWDGRLHHRPAGAASASSGRGGPAPSAERVATSPTGEPAAEAATAAVRHRTAPFTNPSGWEVGGRPGSPRRTGSRRLDGNRLSRPV